MEGPSATGACTPRTGAPKVAAAAPDDGRLNPAFTRLGPLWGDRSGSPRKAACLPDRAPLASAGVAFAAASLFPGLLIVLAAGLGGLWIWAALIYIGGCVYVLDELAGAAAPQDGGAFRGHGWLLVALTGMHTAVLVLTVQAIAGPELSPGQRAGLFLAAGLFLGQVSNATAHELIHSSPRGLRDLGRWIYISLLFGHHASAHRLVHHVHVATPRDPNSAWLGESFYHFMPRAWAGSFRSGLAAETALRRRGGQSRLHPYVLYLGGAALWLIGVAALYGPAGLLGYLLLAAFAQSQLMLSDYVQHYGLSRRITANGKAEPPGPQHSWNAPHWLSGRMMLHATRHSEHHAHPARPFPELTLPAPGMAPMLPRSLPAMASLALVPRLWRQVMDPRALAWHPGIELRHAAE